MWVMTDAHFVEVVDWMLAGVPNKRVMELCRMELGLPAAKIPSKATLSVFWHEFSPHWLAVHRESNARIIAAMNAEIEAAPLRIDGALREEIKRRAWELLQHPRPPQNLVRTFLGAVLKLRGQDGRAETRQLDREKLVAAQRAKIGEGLESLRAEIAGNPSAMVAWEALKAALAA